MVVIDNEMIMVMKESNENSNDSMIIMKKNGNEMKMKWKKKVVKIMKWNNENDNVKKPMMGEDEIMKKWNEINEW